MPQQPPPQASATFFLLLLFLFLSNNNTLPPPGFPGSPRDHAISQVAHLQDSYSVLNSSHWADFSPHTSSTPPDERGRYLNLTGFREQDGYAWNHVDTFWNMSREIAELHKVTATNAIYKNVTGIVSGTWKRYKDHEIQSGETTYRRFNLSEISPTTDWAIESELAWSRNITGSEGKMRLSVEEKDEQEGAAEVDSLEASVKTVREVRATLNIQDETSNGDGWDTMLHGVHWPETGAMLFTTTSDKFAGIFGLPHLTLNVDQFTSSRMLLNRTVEKKVREMERAFWPDISNPWPSSFEGPRDIAFPTPYCELVVYTQVHQLTLGLLHQKNHPDPGSIVDSIEQELRFPNGAPISEIPELRMSTVIFSPDCGFILESKGPPKVPFTEGNHLEGRKKEVYIHKVQSWVLLFAIVIFGQMFLLKIQTRDASTPSTIGRVSIGTSIMMLMADGMLFICLFVASATSPAVFPSGPIAAFATLQSTVVSGRFIQTVYNVQEPERRERLRQQRAAQDANRPRPTQPATTATPPAQTNNTPIIIPSDQDIQAEIDEVARAASAVPVLTLPTTNTPGITPPPPRPENIATVYMRFSGFTISLLFLSLAATTWPAPIRNTYTNVLSFTYLSFWVPQIYRNVVRNCRKALLWKFVMGQSVLRLLPFAYFYLKKDTILFTEPDWISFSVLTGWVWIQILVLIAQAVLGPRYGVPRTWTEEAWDYHPVLSEDNVEAGGMPIGLVRAPGSPTTDRAGEADDEDDDGGRKKSHDGMRSVDCAICMQILEVPVAASGVDNNVTGILARRMYMVTPCRHIFHSPCLEGWMRFRLQCPICREDLPPL